MSVGEEAELLAPYKEGLFQRFRVRKSTLDDLYIRFYRLAEWRIAEQRDRRGIVSYISNWSWLAGSSFPVMREHLIRNFDTMRIDSLGGGIRGRDRRIEEADQNVFTTRSSPGIRLGVAISFLVVSGRDERGEPQAKIWYRRFFGTADEKRAALLKSLEDNDASVPYIPLHPSGERKWVLRPSGEPGAYDTWVSLGRLLPVRETGVNENRGGALIAVDPQPLEELRLAYMDGSIDDQRVEQCSARGKLLMKKYARYDPSRVRAALRRAGQVEVPRVVRFAFKAFDDRWLLWGGDKLLNEKRRELFALVDLDSVPPVERNVFLVACENARVAYDLPGVTTYLGDVHYQDPWAQFFPLRHRVQAKGFLPAITRPNLDADVLTALTQAWNMPSSDLDKDATPEEMAIGEAIFYHVLATMHTPAYRAAHEDALASNWARIPVPLSSELLLESARLGRRVAELLRTDLQPAGVVAGEVPLRLRLIARPQRADGSPLRDPEDFSVTVNYRGAGTGPPTLIDL
jgi:predicted helicase